MFATGSRKRQHQQERHSHSRPHQEESPPLPGMDSTYGVKSLSDWGGESAQSDMDPEHQQSARTADEAELGQAQEVEEGLKAELRTALDDRVTVQAAVQAPLSPSLGLASSNSSLPVAEEPTAPDQTQATPMPSQPSLPPPAEPAFFSPTPLSPNRAGLRYALRDLDMRREDEDEDDPSEPSSPASFASLPSFIASASSMSRTSSPASGTGFHGYDRQPTHTYSHVARTLHYTRQDGNVMFSAAAADSLVASQNEGEGGLHGSSELVLPVLALDEGSLHASQQPGDSAQSPGGGAIKVIVLADAVEQEQVLAELARRVALERFSEGVWIIRSGTHPTTLLIRLEDDVETVKRAVRAGYDRLHAMLPHTLGPDPSDRIGSLMRSFSMRSPNWVHAAVVAESHNLHVDELAALLPTISLSYNGQATLYRPAPTSSRGVESPSIRAQNFDQPTPMPTASGEAPSYFAHDTQTTEDEQAPPIANIVDKIFHLANDVPALCAASTAAFLACRPIPLDASVSSHSSSATPLSSAFESAGTTDPIPTVIRAQGLTEWEANLSRRLAKRKDLSAAEAAYSSRTVRDRGPRGTKARRRSSREVLGSKERCGGIPLFPPSAAGGSKSDVPSMESSSRSSVIGPASIVGLSELVRKTFEPVNWILRSRWTWGAAAVMAFAVAVGWGYWGVQGIRA